MRRVQIAHTKPAMPKFTHHIFVCCNQREPGHSRGCCDPQGSENLRNLFKSEVKRRGLTPQVRANKAGCLDQCECGPTVVIYPQEIWYGGVTAEDVPRIIEETIVNGRVIEELLIADECLNTKGGRISSATSPSTSQKKTS
jgi:(2Fe-2S) ferredoxin